MGGLEFKGMWELRMGVGREMFCRVDRGEAWGGGGGVEGYQESGGEMEVVREGSQGAEVRGRQRA